MAKQKLVVRFGAAPRVDLLPAAQREDLRLERLMPTLGLAVVASLALAGLIWVAGFVPVQSAKQQLLEAEAESSDLVAKIAGHADLQKTLSQEKELSTQRVSLTQAEVMFGERLTELAKLLPNGATFTSYDGSLASADPAAEGATAQGVNLNPLCVPEAATLLVKFSTETLDPSATFVKRIDAKTVTGFQCIVATKVEKTQKSDPLQVTVQVALNKDAFAKRFEEKTP